MSASRRPLLGFTLLELSISLAIIGLLLGGVMVGKDLIFAATIRSQVSQIEKFNAATATFQTKYGCLPGDCKYAEKFFGTASGCYYYDWHKFTSGTCNGDGDGTISGKSCNASTSYGSPTCQEDLFYFEMLWVSGLIAEGPFGVADYPMNLPGVTVAQSKLSPNVGVSMHWYNDTFPCCGWVSYPDLNYQHLWTIGSLYGGNYFLHNLGVSPNQAHAIDAKIDDGNGETGNVRAYHDYRNNCLIDATGVYVSGDFTGDWGPNIYQGCYLMIRAPF